MNALPETSPQLWAKGLPLDRILHRFTVGDDPLLDLALVPFDALGSAAHALTLAKDHFISMDDARALVHALQEIALEAKSGLFRILPEQEDGHTAIEARLVERTGDAGKRIHLGRSRNDQVILATRLFMREELIAAGESLVTLARAFVAFARAHKDLPMPGYTHLRRAMPSSIGQWTSAFAESLLEELDNLRAVYARLDRCPAGAAAGFGAPVALDRGHTATLLGFSRVQRNPVDVQNSRGRHELAAVQALTSVSNTLEKWLWDVALYSSEEFGFLKLPDAFTTGSSIMPQKRNPDVIELARASCRELRATAATLEAIATGLPSNYHRDLQLLKKPLLFSMERSKTLFGVLAHLLPGISPVPEKLKAACTQDLLAAGEASRRVGNGETFRDAYRAVAEELLHGRFAPEVESGAGMIGDGYLDVLDEELAAHAAWLDERAAWHAAHAHDIWSRA